jgi:hypothetical protein
VSQHVWSAYLSNGSVTFSNVGVTNAAVSASPPASDNYPEDPIDNVNEVHPVSINAWLATEGIDFVTLQGFSVHGPAPATRRSRSSISCLLCSSSVKL